jgi:WD40 repeat protein
LLWNGVTGDDPLFPIHGQGYSIAGVAYTSKDNNFVTTEDNGEIEVWNIEHGNGPSLNSIPSLNAKDKINTVTYSPDGTNIAFLIADSKTITVWDTWRRWDSSAYKKDATYKNRFFTSIGEANTPVRAFAYHPEGTQIAVAYDDGIRVWDAGTNMEQIQYMLYSDNEWVCISKIENTYNVSARGESHLEVQGATGRKSPVFDTSENSKDHKQFKKMNSNNPVGRRE